MHIELAKNLSSLKFREAIARKKAEFYEKTSSKSSKMRYLKAVKLQHTELEQLAH